MTECTAVQRLTLLVLLLVSLLNSSPARADGGCSATASPHWSNELDFPFDPFQASSAWVKLTILLCDPDTVYFQDGNEYRFHYDFATRYLQPLAGLDTVSFDRLTLHAGEQVAVLGAVLFQPGNADTTRELGIQLLRNDPFTVDEVVQWFALIRSRIKAGPEVRSYYFPSFAQQAAAEAQRQELTDRGIEVSSPARWMQHDACYSEGWAYGRLRMVASADIDEAVLQGTLRPEDVLLTDGEPRELPPVAGIVSLTPVTPSSHVAILAQTFGTPLVYLADATARQRALQLAGRTVALRTFSDGGTCRADLLDMTGLLSSAQQTELLALKQPQAIAYPPLQSPGTLTSSCDGLTLDDSRYYGGKAAGFGLLRRAVPNSSPVAMAVSFDLWEAFLDQPLPGTGVALRQEISSRLQGFSSPPELPALSAALAEIRDLIRDPGSTDLPVVLTADLLQQLQDPASGFDPEVRLRFRSSTNLEDTEHFTGAGLYDSYSGCLADDLDGDDTGPSLCDASMADERGVLRAVRRVFASFYNDNAVLARLRYGVNEHEVGMALLVHHSFPDEIELANGVAVLDTTAEWGGSTVTIVSQTGAHPVTNPEPGSRPEVVEVTIYGDGRYPELVDTSNLLVLGDTVLAWDQEYRDLVELLLVVAEQYERETGKDRYRLEYEYKKVAPAGDSVPLVLKQVRQLAVPDTTPSVTPLLAGVATELCTYTGEDGEVTANHRLKVVMTVQTESLWLTPEDLQDGFWRRATIEHRQGCRLDTWHGPVSELPGSSYQLLDGNPTLQWSEPDHPTPRDLSLSLSPFATVGSPVAPGECPIITLADLGQLRLQAEYRQPLSGWRFDDPTRTTTQDEVWLAPCLQPSANDFLQERVLADGSGVSIATSFTWPSLPSDRKDGKDWVFIKTVPVVQFIETVIEGLTTEPLVLHDQYAQTYHPHHHNFSEDFLFDPWLDPEVPDDQLRELADLGVRSIVATSLLDGAANIDLLADEEGCNRLPPQPRRPRPRRTANNLF